MFINKLGLKNFKCFKEVEVDFSKITLLTGENSSGKSSLIYGLLAPFQSEGFPLYLFPNGKYVNMGDFEEISFKNLKKNKIAIHINLNINNIDLNDDNCFMFVDNHDIFTEWILDPVNKLPSICYLCHIIDEKNRLYMHGIKWCEKCYSYYDYQQKDKNKIDEFKNKINSLDEKILTGISHGLLSESHGLLSEEFNNKINNLDERMFTGISHGLLNYEYSFMFAEIDELLNFIGSYKISPERTYYQKPKAKSKISSSGEGFIDQILEWQEKKDQEFNQLITILKELKILYDIKPQKIGGGRFDLKIKVKRGSNWASLADVGFGVSQLLPIIIADLQLVDNSALIMSQPETHLHPSIQAELGTYLVKQVNQSEKQYIVETHSEYLINRLRLCIVKGVIKPEDVAVYYFENTVKEGSIAHRIEFTKHGQIFNAPPGFFDTYMMDTMNIALNA
jgi:predicted ATPase